PNRRRKAGRPRVGCSLCPRRLGAQGRRSRPHYRAAHRCAERRASLGRPLRWLIRRCVRPSRQSGVERRRRHRTDLTGPPEGPADRPTSDLTAYDLYLRAYAMVLSSGAIPEALQLMEQAIARDPGYGPHSPGPRTTMFDAAPTARATILGRTVGRAAILPGEP